MLKLNQVTSSIGFDKIVLDMVREYQGHEKSIDKSIIDYNKTSKQHAINKLSSHFMNDIEEGMSFTREFLKGSVDAYISRIPIIIYTPFYHSMNKDKKFDSFLSQKRLYMRSQMAMWLSGKQSIYFCQWSPHDFKIEMDHRDDFYIEDYAIPYLKSIIEEFNKNKDMPEPTLRDDLIYLVSQIKEYDAQIEILTDLKKELIQKLEQEADGHNIVIGDFEFKKIDRKGSIDYARYLKDHNITNIEDYRKDGSSYWKLS